MTQYQCLWPHLVSFGAGKSRELAQFTRGKSVLFLCDPGLIKAGVAEPILAALKQDADALYSFSDIPAEPTEDQVTDIVGRLDTECRTAPDIIIAAGGGSAMDMAKFVAVMINGQATIQQLLDGRVPQSRKIGLLMIPTTAGTGSEATPNSIVLRPSLNLKVGVVCPAFIPDQVILDPELLAGLPPSITAATGLDAICHALECYVSNKANPISDMFALEALRLLFRSLPIAYRDGKNLTARGETLLAAFYGGVCIASSGTNAVHALSYPLGGRYRIPHGVSNGILLAPTFACNKDSCMEKLATVADLAAQARGISLSGQSEEQKADFLISELFRITRELKIPATLQELGVPATDIDVLVDSAFEVKRLLNNNPKPLTRDDIRGIYQTLFSGA